MSISSINLISPYTSSVAHQQADTAQDQVSTTIRQANLLVETAKANAQVASQKVAELEATAGATTSTNTSSFPTGATQSSGSIDLNV